MEYLIPSTEKLYHHKIHLDFMNKDSNIQEVIKKV